jgi:Mg-chelatase subunit ChlD
VEEPSPGATPDVGPALERKELVALAAPDEAPAAPPAEISVHLPASRGGKLIGGDVVAGDLNYAGAPAAAESLQNAQAANSENVNADAAAPERQKPTALEPFVVRESEEKGSYKANSTLAGTRVRTDLKDAASSVSVVTDQFLDDLGTPTDGKSVSGTGAISQPRDSGDIEVSKSARPASTESIAAGTGGSAQFGARLTGLAKQEIAGQQQAAAVQAPEGAEGDLAALSPFAVDASEDKRSARAISAPAGGSVNGAPESKASPAVNAPAESSASKEPVSTFSLHVSDVSFRLAQAALARGEAPEPSRIRPEEFYNAFDYGDPAPAMNEKVSCRIEQAADPAKQQRNLVRIAMRVPATGRGAGQPLRLTVLLDTSGSMEREDRAAAVRRAVEVLASLLGPKDRVTLVGFARTPSLLADRLPGDKAGQMLDIIARTPAQGGTNIEEALRLGGELARRQYAPAAQNRIVLLTDGAANLGDADPARLAASITALRQQGISFDACGVGIDGINDEILEALTRKGAGRYYVVDTPESADAGFARQLAGAFRPAAENVKVQVRFNPARVGSYRLIGFDQHRLSEADFRNDKVEAAALAAGEAAVALYEVEALPQGEGELGEVYVRFRDTATGSMVERSWTLPYDPYAPSFDRATPTMQLAGTAALMAEKLRGGAEGDGVRLEQLAPVVNALRGRYAQEARVQELVAMFEEMRRLDKE